MTTTLSNVFSSTAVWLAAFAFGAFLLVSWLLRGSPFGQAVEVEDDEEAPLAFNRDRIISAISLGIVLIAVGVVIALTNPVGWSLIAFVPGFAIVLFLVSKIQGYRHASPSLRRTLDFSSTILNGTLLAGILIVINVLAFRYAGEGTDLTSETAFSLSSLSTNQARTLDQPVKFTTFFGRSDVAKQQSDRVHQLLELYRSVQPSKIQVVTIDPFRDFSEFEGLLKRVPELAMTQGGGVVIEYGQEPKVERVVLRNVDLFDLPRTAPFDPNVGRFESIFNGEAAITSALARLREGEKPKVFFTSGHGEIPLNVNNPNAPGLGIWRSRLIATGADVAELNLLQAAIPDDTALIVIAGPVSLFQPEEIQKLQSYVNKKKPLLLLMNEPGKTGLDPILTSFQIRIEQGVILDPLQHYGGSPDALSIPVGGPQNPIVAPLEGRRLLFSRTAPLQRAVVENAPVETVLNPILTTRKEAWSEPDPSRAGFKKTDQAVQGPFVIGMAVTDKPNPAKGPTPVPRLVVFSSRLLGDSRIVQLEPSNLDLLMNTISWLRSREELLGIAPKTHVSLTLTADPVLKARLVLVPTVMSFLLIITLGVVTYLARRD